MGCYIGIAPDAGNRWRKEDKKDTTTTAAHPQLSQGGLPVGTNEPHALNR